MFAQASGDIQISADEVKMLLDKKSDLYLVDVRTAAEYTRGKIENSINLPVDQVVHRATEILPDKNKQIIVYCLSGSRSVYAVAMMREMGYQKVLNMTSGLLAWRANGYKTS